jgi:hypothetical protein
MRLPELVLLTTAVQFACGPAPIPRDCFSEVQRPAVCATTWGTARTWCTESRPCTEAVTCTYPGMGDILTGQRCPANAVNTCVEGVWRCAQ